MLDEGRECRDVVNIRREPRPRTGELSAARGRVSRRALGWFLFGFGMLFTVYRLTVA